MVKLVFPGKEFTTSRALHYSYIHITTPSEHPGRPTLLFLHGFPSIAVDFYNQLERFSALGYGVIAPDLIGYGLSSRPSDPEDYKHKCIVEDLVELLDSQSIATVIGISHDFGAQILTRLEFYHPSRVDKLIFLTIGPIAIGQEFDLDAVNTMTRDMLGYEGFGYQDFLTRNDDATSLLAKHSTSFHDLIFTTEHDLWKDYFGKIGGLQKWLSEDSKCQTIPGFPQELQELHSRAFDSSVGGYEGSKNWYMGLVNNLNIDDDKARLHELNMDAYKLQKGKKVLLITAGKDVIAFPKVQEDMTRQYVSDAAADLTVKTVNAGHWVGLEQADEVNLMIEQFLAQT